MRDELEGCGDTVGLELEGRVETEAPRLPGTLLQTRQQAGTLLVKAQNPALCRLVIFVSADQRLESARVPSPNRVCIEGSISMGRTFIDRS